jgi:signal peptidase I
MTSVDGGALHPSPWLTVWVRPRETIERIVASNPRHHVLLLACLGGMASMAAMLLNARLTTGLIDWRIIAFVAVVGSLLGIVSLYLNGLFSSWCGGLLGGRAPAVALRAALAWGFAPSAIGLVVCLAVLTGLKLFGGTNVPPSPSGTLLVVLQVVTGAFGLWSVVAMLLMIGRVERFGFWRTITCASLASVLALVLALLIRTFLFQPFNIPAASMKPSMLVGDHFFVSKFRYGYSTYSLPY